MDNMTNDIVLSKSCIAKMTSKKAQKKRIRMVESFKPWGDTSEQTTAGVAVANLNERVSSKVSAVASEGFLFW